MSAMRYLGVRNPSWRLGLGVAGNQGLPSAVQLANVGSRIRWTKTFSQVLASSQRVAGSNKQTLVNWLTRLEIGRHLCKIILT